MTWIFSAFLFLSTSEAQEGTVTAPDLQQGFRVEEEKEEEKQPSMYIIQPRACGKH